MAPLARTSPASVRIPSVAGCARVIMKLPKLVFLGGSNTEPKVEWKQLDHVCLSTSPLDHEAPVEPSDAT